MVSRSPQPLRCDLSGSFWGLGVVVEDFFPPSCDCRNINQKHSIFFLAQETKASCEEAEPGLSLLALSLGERCVLSSGRSCSRCSQCLIKVLVVVCSDSHPFPICKYKITKQIFSLLLPIGFGGFFVRRLQCVSFAVDIDKVPAS